MDAETVYAQILIKHGVKLQDHVYHLYHAVTFQILVVIVYQLNLVSQFVL